MQDAALHKITLPGKLGRVFYYKHMCLVELGSERSGNVRIGSEMIGKDSFLPKTKNIINARLGTSLTGPSWPCLEGRCYALIGKEWFLP